MTAAIRPEELLGELEELWVSLGEETGVLRACTMTLTVVTEDSPSATDPGETIARLMRQHPSRAIVIRVRGDAGAPLEARVVAQCWMPFGDRQQICCEQIEMAASRASLAGVAALLPALIAPDLPVVLWCRSPSLVTEPAWQALAATAGKLILDSAGFSRPCQALESVRACAGGRMAVADLAWTRLTPWRETIAQAFGGPGGRERLRRITELIICCKEPATPAAGYYMAGWLLAAFAQDREPSCRFDWSSPEAVVRLLGPEGDISIPAAGERDECEWLGEELKIPGRDPVYEQSLARACRLASRQGDDR